jgi:hypothetical protein
LDYPIRQSIVDQRLARIHEINKNKLNKNIFGRQERMDTKHDQNII